MILTKKVIVKWNNNNRKHYESKGYIFTKNNDEFEVNAEDLTDSSKVDIEYECDVCAEGCKVTNNKPYKLIIKGRKTLNLDVCDNPECITVKRKLCTEKKYGVSNVMRVEEIKNKVKETNLEKYGVEYAIGASEVRSKIVETNNDKYGGDSPFSSKLVQDKAKNTIKEKYGVENVSQNESIRQKKKETNIKRYGVENPLQNEDIIKKRNDTIIERYGVENPMQNEEIKRKSRINYNKVMCSNGKMPCSSQQNHLHLILGGELNYPVDEIVLDIAFPKDKLYIEYDGGGHDYSVKIGSVTEKDFKNKEIRRYYFMKNKGWKYIRIKSINDNLPSNDEIISFVDFAKDYLKNNSWISLDIDNKVIEGSKIQKSIEFKEMLTKKEIYEMYKDADLQYTFR